MKKMNAKKWLAVGLCIVAGVSMIACGKPKENTGNDKPEDKKEADQDKKDAMTGTAVMKGTSTEELMGGAQGECTTTLSVDFDKKEAVIKIDCVMAVGEDGATMEFTLVDEKKGEDATRYMQCMEFGKGKVTDNGDGTYTATWKVTLEDAGETEYKVDITAGEDGVCTAKVPFEGLFAEPVEVSTENE